MTSVTACLILFKDTHREGPQFVSSWFNDKAMEWHYNFWKLWTANIIVRLLRSKYHHFISLIGGLLCGKTRLPRWPSGKGSAGQCRRHRFDPGIGQIPWKRKWQPTPVFLPGKFHGQKSLVGYRPWGLRESDMTEHTCTHMERQLLGVGS